MPDISLKQTHKLGLAKAKKAAQKVADDLQREYGLHSEWDGNTLNFKRTGVSGTMQVSKTEIQIDIKLGLLLGAFRDQIEQNVAGSLNKLVG